MYKYCVINDFHNFLTLFDNSHQGEATSSASLLVFLIFCLYRYWNYKKDLMRFKEIKKTLASMAF